MALDHRNDSSNCCFSDEEEDQISIVIESAHWVTLFGKSLSCHQRRAIANHKKICDAFYDTPKAAVDAKDVCSLERCLQLLTSANYNIENYVVRGTYKTLTLLQYAVTEAPLDYKIIETILKCTTAYADTCNTCPLYALLSSENRCYEDQYDLIKLLMDNDANPSVVLSFGASLLNYFISEWQQHHLDCPNFKDILYLLLSKGCDINQKDINGNTGLRNLIVFSRKHLGDDVYNSKKTSVVQLLVEVGADVHATNNDGETLLHTAVFAMNFPLCRYLISKGVNGNQNSVSNGGNVLFEMVYVRQLFPDLPDEQFSMMIELLLHEGNVDVNMAGIDGSTVLHHVTERISLENGKTLLEMLIMNGADPFLTDFCGNTVLHRAARASNAASVGYLIAHYPSLVNKVNHRGMTSVHFVCCVDNDEVLALMLKSDLVDVQLCGPFNTTGLHMLAFPTASLKDGNCVPLLVSQGLDINSKDINGSTALHYAAAANQHNLICTLLKNGARAGLKDNLSLTAADIAMDLGHLEVISELRKVCNDGMFQHLPLSYIDASDLKKTITVSGLADYTDKLYATVKSASYNILQEKSKTLLGPNVKIQTLLRPMKLQWVDQGDMRNRAVKASIESFCNEIVNTISAHDGRFSGRLVPGGSSYENVKVGYPDEFDFMVELIKFTGAVKDVEISDYPGFLYVKTQLTDKSYKRFLTPDGYLDSASIMNEFHNLFWMAVTRVHGSQKFSNVINVSNCMFHNLTNYAAEVNSLISFEVWILSDYYKVLRVSVDINPVLYVRNNPNVSHAESLLIGNIKEHGFHLIPKYLKPRNEQMVADPDVKRWRVSFSVLETLIFQNFPEEVLQGFAFIKALRMWPLCPSFHQKNSYMALDEFKALTSAEKANNASNREENDNNSLSNGLSDMLCTDSECKSTDFDTDLENFDEDKYDIITPECCISTYALKQLFLAELDEIVQNGQELRTMPLISLAKSVYIKYMETQQVGRLQSYFIPSQNLHHSPSPEFSFDTEVENFETVVQRSVCHHIINLLDRCEAEQLFA